jgi:hypothetical protein
MTEAVPHQFVTDMGDVPTEPQPQVAEATESTEQTSRRGRPRSQEAIARDEAVYGTLADGAQLTRNEIAEKLGFAGGLTYLSIYRLRREGRVVRVSDGTTRRAWRRTTDEEQAEFLAAQAAPATESSES